MITDIEYDQDLHATVENADLKTEKMVVVDVNIPNPSSGEKDLWLDANQASVFYSDDFPPLPDFPCISSSSSSSSVQLADVNPIAAASSSSSPTAEDGYFCDQPRAEPSALSSTASMKINPPPSPAEYIGVTAASVDCVDVMETFGYMDLLDSNDIWDPSSVFQTDHNPKEFTEDQQAESPTPPPDQKMLSEEENEYGFSFIQGNHELAMIFFDWLKQNKDYISAEDMRNIKLKRSTIESASKRLGSTKEGKKQLLKLILDWVEQFQLHKNRATERSSQQSTFRSQETAQNLVFNPNSYSQSNMIYNPAHLLPAPCFPTTPWMPSMEGYSGGDPCTNYIQHGGPLNYQIANGIPFPAPAEYSAMEHAQSWAPIAPFTMPPPSQFSPFADNGSLFPQPHNLYGNPYLLFDKNEERSVRLGSTATKEARKKRMAHQRSLYSYQSRRNSNQNQNHDQHAVADDCEKGIKNSPTRECVYWSSFASSANSSMMAPVDASHQPRQGVFDRWQQQQGWKTEKNLKFLLQKVLKQSDVGNLGRIVLPKKEAESHLPELDSRDGIPIAMEDIGTSRVWNMRYRFWPNNKSRMYLLENTGEFVRMNGLQEGDFIVIYSDSKCGKYLIRGVKVRQPGTKLEGKKPWTKKNARNLSILRSSPSLLAPVKRSI